MSENGGTWLGFQNTNSSNPPQDLIRFYKNECKTFPQHHIRMTSTWSVSPICFIIQNSYFRQSVESDVINEPLKTLCFRFSLPIIRATHLQVFQSLSHQIVKLSGNSYLILRVCIKLNLNKSSSYLVLI